MVVHDVVARKITNAAARLSEIEQLVDRSREEFVADRQGHDLAAFYFQLAIQECIDLASHWVAESQWRPPDDAASAFDVLADHDLISPEVATTMRLAVGLRNRIAHGYATVEHGRLYDEILAGQGEIRSFLSTLAEAAGLTESD